MSAIKLTFVVDGVYTPTRLTTPSGAVRSCCCSSGVGKDSSSKLRQDNEDTVDLQAPGGRGDCPWKKFSGSKRDTNDGS